MKKKKIRVGLWATLTSVTAVLLSLSLIGAPIALSNKSNVDKFLGVSGASVSGGSGNEYYTSDYAYTVEGETQLLADQQDLYRQIVAEGTVLLKNENNALPLSAADGTVNIFGNAGPQYLSGLNSSLKNEGFTVNDDCWNFYATGGQNVTGNAVNENPWAAVTSQNWYKSLGGTAIVVLGRRGQEGSDDQWTEERDYLALSTEEKDMLNGVAELKRSGTFSKMIVIMTCTNTINYADGDWNDAIDSILWLGNVNDLGTEALAGIISGETNPSGRLSDTIYKNAHDNPVMTNFGRISADLSLLSDGKSDEVQALSDEWKPSSDKGNHWRRNYVYAEGIYVGYRYYETRYEDVVLGTPNVGNFNYADYVAYPFGYGLSYTEFSYSDFQVTETDSGFDVSVTVTNTGNSTGKHSVTVYMQSPYTDYDKQNGVEKAAVELVGYEKTQLLDPGASESVTVSVAKTELRSYDSNNAKTYILDAGDYYFTIGESSHDAVNNILAAKGMTVTNGMTDSGNASLVYVWNNPTLDTEIFATSAVTGNAITNLFDESDPNKNEELSKNNNVVWLSRSDWEGTFPKQAISLVYTDAIADLAKPITYQAGSGDASSVPTHKFGSTETSLTLVDMYGKDYDDPDWENLVSQMTYEEMVTFINDPEGAVASVGKVKGTAGNGSTGRSETFVASGLQGISYTSTEIRAATFNKDIHEAVGAMTGENLLHSSTTDSKKAALYGWSCDTHRSPYSGRNNEYYSEDPYLSGQACAAETRGIVGKGGIVFTKHYAVNDQEEYRHGVTAWLNEQALREIYLAPFEEAIVNGGANGLMNGFNRVGIKWAGEYYNLQVAYLEDELGYKGITLTDQYESDYQDSVDGILNGTHAWLGGGTYKVCYEVLLMDEYRNDPVIQDALFNAVKRNLYVDANSMIINGMSSDTVVEESVSWWVPALTAVEIFFALATAGCAAMLVLNIVNYQKRKKAIEWIMRN